jgi:hypothetical protein
MRLLVTLTAFVIAFASGVSFAEDEAKIPEDLAKVMKFYVGNWTLEGSVGDAPLKGRAVFRMPPSEHCILGTVSYRCKGERSTFSLVSGWDSSTGWSTEQGVDASGEVYKIKWRKVSDTEEEGELVGSSQGQAVSQKTRLERKGDNVVVVSCTERKTGDEVEPDVTFVYRRVTEEDKKPKANR